MKFSKTSKRDSCNASIVSLSSQVSLSSKLSGTSKSSKSSMASSLAQAKLATAAAWTSIKKTSSKLKRSKKTPSSPRPLSVIDNPFNDFTYRMDEPTRVSRLVNRLSRQSRYSAIDDNDVQTHSLRSYDSDDDCDIFSGQPFWAGREQSYSAAYNDKMTVVVTTEAHAHGARYANAAPYERIDDEWYL